MLSGPESECEAQSVLHLSRRTHLAHPMGEGTPFHTSLALAVRVLSLRDAHALESKSQAPVPRRLSCL